MRNASAPADDEAADEAADEGADDQADSIATPTGAAPTAGASSGEADDTAGDVGPGVVGHPDRTGYVPQPRTAPGAESDDPGLPTPAPPADPALSGRDREILAFEHRWWKHAGAKEQAIRDAFDLSATRYYQILNGLLDNPAALAAEPMLVGRLRRLRAARSRNRRR